jgi:zinc transport system ATP-binding protein
MDDLVVVFDAVDASYEGERVAALHDVTLHVRAGERVVVSGPNGAGKTTLLEVTNGLLSFQHGEVRVLGRPIATEGRRLRTEIAYMPQDLFFSPTTPYLVRDVVMAARYAQIGPFRWPSSEDRRHVARALDAVGVLPLAGRPIGRLSGGQQRKTLLARALAQRSRLLLLDEPTANLDPAARDDVARVVREIEDELGATAIVVSHEAGPLLDDADRLVRIEDGRITTDAPCHGAARASVGVGVS